MSNKEMLRDLERAHHNIGAVRLRMNIQELLEPDREESEEQINDAVASLVRVHEQLRHLKRSKGRRL